MDHLLKLAIEAHGGLERWRQFNVVRANASITGALWHLKGQPDVLKNVYTHRVAISNHRLLSVDDREVSFGWKDYAHHNKRRVMTRRTRSFFAVSLNTYSEQSGSTQDQLP
jgi:Putative transposase